MKLKEEKVKIGRRRRRLNGSKKKNGKTWMALLLALYLSAFEKVLYVSAEKGIH